MTERADAGERGYYSRKNRNQGHGQPTPAADGTEPNDPNPGGTDMNTVKRGAGRPAATATRNRHAQRTPLPPKPGSPGAEAIAEAKIPQRAKQRENFENALEADRKGYGAMTVADLRKVAKSLGVVGYSLMAKGALLTAILEAERASDAKVLAEYQEHAGKIDAMTDDEEADDETTPVEPNKIDQSRQADLAKMAEAAPQTKSWQKALAFRGSVAALGWSTSCDFAPDGEPEDIVEVMAQREDEHLWISWTGGAMTLQPMPSYTISDRTIKLKNASACLKYAARDPKAAHDELGKVVSNKAFRRKAETPKKARIPFDIGLATDEEVIAALAGHSVDWYNSISGAMESGVLGRDAHRIKIQALDGGDRIVKFCCYATGFRAFRLSALTRVGGYSKVTVVTERKEG